MGQSRLHRLKSDKYAENIDKKGIKKPVVVAEVTEVVEDKMSTQNILVLSFLAFVLLGR